MQRIDRMVATPIEALEDGDVFIWIDWREEEDSIVAAVSRHLGPEDALEPELRGEELWVQWRGQAHRIPLTITPHDRHVCVSSLAALLAGRYRFWLLESRLNDDTHALLVLTAEESAYLESRHGGWVAANLVPLDIGFDYFNGIRVPYWGNENHNPDFARQAQELREGREKAAPELEAMFHQIMKDAGIKPGFGLEAALKLGRKPWWKFW